MNKTKKIFTALSLILLLVILLKEFIEPISSVNAKFSIQHKALIQMNKCDSEEDCAIILGTNTTHCFYLINYKDQKVAIKRLSETGKKLGTCAALNSVSGVICYQNKCQIGEGSMPKNIDW